MRTETEWLGASDVLTWVEASRLNLVKGLDEQGDKAAVADLQRRLVTALFPALAKLDAFGRTPRAPSAPGCSRGRCRTEGTSVNVFIVESLAADIACVRKDEDFTARAARLLRRDKALLDRLGR